MRSYFAHAAGLVTLFLLLISQGAVLAHPTDGISNGTTTRTATKHGLPLADLLNPAGPINLRSGYPGTRDPAGGQLALGTDGPARFAPSAKIVAPQAVPARQPAFARTPAGGPVVCRLGLYVTNLGNIDVKDGSFYADFYLWEVWQAPEADICAVEFQNGVKVDRQALGEDDRRGDQHWRQWRVRGTFQASYDLSHYPFDIQTLPIVLESPLAPLDRVRLEPTAPDTHEQSLHWRGLAPEVAVDNWEIQAVEFTSAPYQYNSAFGYPYGDQQAHADYSRLTYAVRLGRQSAPYVLRAFLPLLLIAIFCCLIIPLGPEKLDIGLSIGITALLAAIALHLTTAGDLPALAYIVPLDQLFLLTYIFIVLIVVQRVAVYQLVTTNRPLVSARLDRLTVIGLPALYLLLGGLIIIAHI